MFTIYLMKQFSAIDSVTVCNAHMMVMRILFIMKTFLMTSHVTRRHVTSGMSRHDKRCEICPGSPAWHCRHGVGDTLLVMGGIIVVSSNSDEEYLIRLLMVLTRSLSSLSIGSNFLFFGSWFAFEFDVKMLKMFFSGEKTIVMIFQTLWISYNFIERYLKQYS